MGIRYMLYVPLVYAEDKKGIENLPQERINNLTNSRFTDT